MIDSQANYFDMLSDDKRKSYEGLVFGQLARCLFIGSLDMTNAGKVFIQDAQGNAREIVRDNFENAFINSVKRLYQLMRFKMKNITLSFKERTYEEAEDNFDTLLTHIHESGIFGRNTMVMVLDWRNYKGSNGEQN